MKTVKLLSLLLFFLVSIAANAGSIKGHVSDSIGKPMPYATVWIESINRTTVTGLDGSFTLRDVPAGNYKVFATFIGYKKVTENVHVKSDGATCNFVIGEGSEVLPDVFVTPTGESIEQFIERMVAENKKSLKDVVKSCDVKGSLYWEADKDSMVYYLPNEEYKIIKFALSLFKLGKLFALEHDNPGAKFIIDQNINFDGKLRGGKQAVVEMNPALNSEEVAYLERHSWGIDENFYDNIYSRFDIKKIMKSREKARKAEEKAQKKGEELDDDTTAVRYLGTYSEDGHDLYIIKKGRSEFHIVDKIWQIKRVARNDKDIHAILEFREMLPDVYLPVSCYLNSSLSVVDVKEVQKSLDEAKAKDRSKLSKKEITRLDKEIKSLEQQIAHPKWEEKRCVTWDYQNIIPADPKK